MTSQKLLKNFQSYRFSTIKKFLPRKRRPMSAFPLRAEIFSTTQMEEYARSLASSHKISHQKILDRLLSRLAENEKVLRASCLLNHQNEQYAPSRTGRSRNGSWIIFT